MERVLTATTEITTIKQGNSTPSDFAELTKTGLKTIRPLLKMPPGEIFYGEFPGMREYAVSVSDKFNFNIEDYDSHNTDVKHLVPEVRGLDDRMYHDGTFQSGEIGHLS